MFQLHCNIPHLIILANGIYVIPLYSFFNRRCGVTFMIIENLLIVTIDVIPFVVAHFAIVLSFGSCYCLHVF